MLSCLGLSLLSAIVTALQGERSRSFWYSTMDRWVMGYSLVYSRFRQQCKKKSSFRPQYSFNASFLALPEPSALERRLAYTKGFYANCCGGLVAGAGTLPTGTALNCKDTKDQGGCFPGQAPTCCGIPVSDDWIAFLVSLTKCRSSMSKEIYSGRSVAR